MNEHNPFEAPANPFDTASQQFPNREYGGIHRGAYFGLSFVMGVINNILSRTVGPDGGAILVGGVVVGFVVTIALAVQRLKNLGYSGWWSIGMFVPILNILVGLRCLACPEGYADHKTLDSTGKVILGLVFGLFILFVAFIVLAVQR